MPSRPDKVQTVSSDSEHKTEPENKPPVEAIPVIARMPTVPSKEPAPQLPALVQPPPSPAQPVPEPIPAPPPSEPMPVAEQPDQAPAPPPDQTQFTPKVQEPLPPNPETPEQPEIEPEKVAKSELEPAPPSFEHGRLLTLGTDFPHLQSAQTGCYGLSSCHQLSDVGSYHRAAETLVAQMQQQGFQISEKEDIDFPGQRVFSVIMPDQPEETYYLNIFSDGIGSAVYVLSIEILTLSDLKSLNG